MKGISKKDIEAVLMTSVDETKRSLFVLPESKEMKNRKSSINNTYVFIYGGYDSAITRSICNVLNDLDIEITFEQNGEINSIVHENLSVMINDELVRSLIDRLNDIEVHNEGDNMPIEKEAILFTLFQEINSLLK